MNTEQMRISKPCSIASGKQAENMQGVTYSKRDIAIWATVLT